ncbi:uncharacterized protein LOC119689676 [Teleopsis dalmanni]|uniref:uncharacterized protein LOC119689676 n=1 Tax=Teleopsis dalmanni TaxID=139649 RepID=UPI0018CF3B0B|nr:uncharacterized protein LOC119689676 [Teleopsis dalmanni]XP_037960487.1 uncharacterized protein LOC119689676 [Teleopsis dalmanni]
MLGKKRMAKSTVTADPGILCFHHCNVKVFCFTLPLRCPNCESELDAACKNDGEGVGRGGGLPSSREYGNESDESGNSSEDCQNGDGGEDGVKDDTNIQSADNNVIGHTQSDSNNIGGNSDIVDVEVNNRYSSDNISPSKILPFRLPYPFVRASQYPCAIVLRPTIGDFLNDYNNATDLHIAVTTSTGCIVEFDQHGLQRKRADNMPIWWQCLLVGNVPEPWYDYWDQVLLQICKQPERWSVAKYHEDTHNCYTFVLAFLQALSYEKLSEAATSKTKFCEKYIVPRTTTAGKYISLYRKLRDASIYVHPQQQNAKAKTSSKPTTSVGLVTPTTALSRTATLCTIEE